MLLLWLLDGLVLSMIHRYRRILTGATLVAFAAMIVHTPLVVAGNVSSSGWMEDEPSGSVELDQLMSNSGADSEQSQSARQTSRGLLESGEYRASQEGQN